MLVSCRHISVSWQMSLAEMSVLSSRPLSSASKCEMDHITSFTVKRFTTSKLTILLATGTSCLISSTNAPELLTDVSLLPASGERILDSSLANLWWENRWMIYHKSDRGGFLLYGLLEAGGVHGKLWGEVTSEK